MLLAACDMRPIRIATDIGLSLGSGRVVVERMYDYRKEVNPMAPTPALDFALLYVSDLETSFDYFTRRLGFTSVPEQDGPGFHYLTGGPGGIDFGLSQTAEGMPAPGTVELYFK